MRLEFQAVLEIIMELDDSDTKDWQVFDGILLESIVKARMIQKHRRWLTEVPPRRLILYVSYPTGNDISEILSDAETFKRDLVKRFRDVGISVTVT